MGMVKCSGNRHYFWFLGGKFCSTSTTFIAVSIKLTNLSDTELMFISSDVVALL